MRSASPSGRLASTIARVFSYGSRLAVGRVPGGHRHHALAGATTRGRPPRSSRTSIGSKRPALRGRSPTHLVAAALGDLDGEEPAAARGTAARPARCDGRSRGRARRRAARRAAREACTSGGVAASSSSATYGGFETMRSNSEPGGTSANRSLARNAAALGQPEPLGVQAGLLEGPGLQSIPTTRTSGARVGDRQSDRAAAGAHVEHPHCARRLDRSAAARSPPAPSPDSPPAPSPDSPRVALARRPRRQAAPASRGRPRPASRSRAAGSACARSPRPRSRGRPCGRSGRRPARGAARRTTSSRRRAARRRSARAPARRRGALAVVPSTWASRISTSRRGDAELARSRRASSRRARDARSRGRAGAGHASLGDAGELLAARLGGETPR